MSDTQAFEPSTGSIAEPVAASWLIEFHAFSVLHLVTVVVLAALMAGSCRIGSRWKGTPRERRFRAAWAWFTIAWNVLATIYYFLPGIFDPVESFPLHVCDVAVWIAPLALLTQKRWLRTLLYFWGIGLSTQAFIQPVVQEGVAGIRFWLFWVGHTQIVGSAIYDIAVLGYRPSRRDLLIAIASILIYAAVLTPFNMALGVNYGYIGNPDPPKPAFLALLGPWPWRLIPMGLLAVAVFTLAWGVWVLADRLRRAGGKPQSPSTTGRT